MKQGVVRYCNQSVVASISWCSTVALSDSVRKSLLVNKTIATSAAEDAQIKGHRSLPPLKHACTVQSNCGMNQFTLVQNRASRLKCLSESNASNVVPVRTFHLLVSMAIC